MHYHWAGDLIFRDTVMPDKRFVIGSPERGVPTDIREWIQPSNTESKSQVLASALKQIPGLPMTKRPGDYDRRVHMIWDFVARHVRYNFDKDRRGYADFWLYAEETLSLADGDCEDSSILLVALLIAAEISPYVVRVVLGHLYSGAQLLGSHAWVVYQDEFAVWRLLESTLDHVPPVFPSADALTRPGHPLIYRPDFCFNGDHLWWIHPPAHPEAGLPHGLQDYMRRQLQSGVFHAGMTPARQQQFHEHCCGR